MGKHEFQTLPSIFRALKSNAGGVDRNAYLQLLDNIP